MRKFLVLFFVLVIAVGLSLIGCEGKAGPTGKAGLDANVCLTPCHNNGGIFGQYKNSTHFIAILNAEEQSAWTAGSCGLCHAKDALESRLDGSVGGGAPTNLLNGQILYLSGTVKESSYNGTSGESANFAQVACMTCHAEANGGQHTQTVYTPANWVLRAPTTAGVYIEKSAAVLTAAGTQLPNWGPGNTCVWCHKSRKDVTDYVKAASVTLSFRWGPHEGPSADLYSGVGGYNFTSKTYTNSAHISALTEGCITCHMPPNPSNGNQPNHDFKPSISSTCTAACHAGVTSIDDIFAAYTSDDEMKTLLDSLQNRFNRFPVAGGTPGIISRTNAPDYVNDLLANSSDPVLTATENADGKYWLDRGRAQRTPVFNSVTGTYTNTAITVSVTKDVAGAFYNYAVVSRSKGYGAHNSVYARQLLYDSNEVVGTALGMGTPLAGLPTRP